MVSVTHETLRGIIRIMEPAKLLTATPILASADTTKTAEFYTGNLNFETVHYAPNEYLIMKLDAVEIHFWYCRDTRIAENTACRIRVSNINALYEQCSSRGIVHPNGKIADVPWGNREFDISDLHGNLITFYEEIEG